MSEDQKPSTPPEDDWVNPIDPEKITENPHTIAFPHHVGSAAIKPEDVGKIKGRAMKAMTQQTERQMSQLYEQMQLLAKQANDIKNRVEVSEKIYGAEMGFEPLIGDTYHLYLRDTGKHVLSIIGPNEWGRKRAMPYQEHVASVRLLADHTWEVIEDLHE